MSLRLPTASIVPLRIPIRNTPASLYNAGYVPPRSLMASFDWTIDYAASAANPDINVLVNVQAGGAQEPIDYIRSVKIDNTGNSFPVYVYFLDTTDTIVAPPDTIVWEPVVTNGKVANVILQGAGNAGLGQTKVYFCNFFVPPYIDPAVNRVVPQWLGSPTIQRSNILTPGFGPPALGDQFFSTPVLLSAGTGKNNSIPLWGCPYSAGFIYVTGIWFSLSNGFTNVANAVIPMFRIKEGSNILCEADLPIADYHINGLNSNNFLALTGLQLRLDATKSWIASDDTIFGGSARWVDQSPASSNFWSYSSFTYNAN